MSQRGVTLKKETSSVLPTNCPFRPPGRCVQPDGSKAHSVCIAGGGPQRLLDSTQGHST